MSNDLQDRLAALRENAAEARRQEARAEATAEALRAKVAEIETVLAEEYGVSTDAETENMLESLRALAAEALDEAEAALRAAEGER